MFMYLFTEVMETETNDVLFIVFTANDVTMIHEILTMSKEAIDSLTYQNDNSNFVSPPPHVLTKLHILKAWNAYLLETNTLKIVDWNDKALVNVITFDKFRALI